MARLVVRQLRLARPPPRLLLLIPWEGKHSGTQKGSLYPGSLDCLGEVEADHHLGTVEVSLVCRSQKVLRPLPRSASLGRRTQPMSRGDHRGWARPLGARE